MDSVVSCPLPPSPLIVLADDDPAVIRLLGRTLEPEGFRVREASDAEALMALAAEEPEVLLLDLRLGAVSGVDLIARVRSLSPDTEIVIMTGFGSVDSAVECMRAGAFDYLEKPFPDRHRVVQTLRRALEHRSLRVRNRELEVELDQRSALDGIAGRAAPMRRVLQMVRDLARNESNVLIQAESGTGKELIARAIHETSPRRRGPFVPVDCGALPEGIFESEFFGYEQGAFSGALRASIGLFRAADGGTLFLDEVGELPPLQQSKLLRAIQEREVRPLGAAAAVAVDVRIVAATNRDLEQEVRAGRFRRDLFYRLRVVAIAIPPLRDRPEDIPLLVAHFLERYARGSNVSGVEPEVLEVLLSQPWEGNVRELENTIERAVALARGTRLTVADLGLDGALDQKPRAELPAGLPLSLDAYERACVEQALMRAQGDVRRAADLLGIGRSTLYRKMRALGLDR